MDRTAIQELQEIAEMYDASDRPLYDAYRRNEKSVLERKIRMIYCPETVPSIEKQGDETAIKFGTGEKKMEQMVKNLVDTIWNQAKHTDGVLKMQVVYFAIVDDLTIKDPEDTTKYTLCQIFRTMKCVDPETKDSIGKCMIFVDGSGRVYQNWEKFKENNKYPKAAIVAPKKGWYRLNDEEILETEVFLTPACSPITSIVNAFDYISLGAGLVAGGVLITSVFMPVAAPLVLTAVGASAGAAAYSGVQSGVRLYDMGAHEQSIGFDNAEAVGHWLSAAGSVVGVASGASAAAVKQMALAGRTTTWAARVATGLSVLSMSVNGVGIGRGLVIIIFRPNDETITAQDYVQMGMALFLFTHSVYNFQTVQEAVRQTQDQTIGDFKKQLSKNARKRLNKKINAATREQGATVAKGDVIRSLRSNPYHQEYFDNNKQPVTAVFDPKTKILIASVVGYVVSKHALDGVITKIRKAITEDGFNILFDISKIITIHFSREMFAFEDVLYDVYVVLDKYAKKHGVNIEKIVQKFKATYESIPSVVRDYFEQILTRVGPTSCPDCNGKNFNTQ